MKTGLAAPNGCPFLRRRRATGQGSLTAPFGFFVAKLFNLAFVVFSGPEDSQRSAITKSDDQKIAAAPVKTATTKPAENATPIVPTAKPAMTR